MAKRIPELQALRDKSEMDYTIALEELLSYSSNPQRAAFLVAKMQTLTLQHYDYGRELDVYLERQRKPWHKRLLGT